MNDQRHYWFPRKHYGWGWGLPLVWQGWLCLAIYATGVALTLHFVRAGREPGWFAVCLTLLTLLLLAVCMIKGEPIARDPEKR